MDYENSELMQQELQCTEECMAERLKAARKVFSRLGLGFAVMVLAATLAAFLISRIPGLADAPWGVWVISFLPQYLVGLPLCLLLVRKLPARAPEKGSLKPGKFLSALIISFFLMYAGNLIGNLISTVLRALLGIAAGNIIESVAMESSLLSKLVFMVLLAPVLEELICRKMLIDRMAVYGEKLAVVTSALIFALFHQNLVQVIYAFGLGVVLGYIYIRTGKIALCMLLHAIINFVGSVLAPLAITDVAAETVGPGVILLGLFVIVCFILGPILLIKNRRLSFNEAEQELPKKYHFKAAWLNVGMALFAVVTLAFTVINAL